MKNMYQVLTKSRRLAVWIIVAIFGGMALLIGFADPEAGFIFAIPCLLLAVFFFICVLLIPLQRLKKDVKRLKETYGYDAEEEWYTNQKLESWLYISEHFVYAVSTMTVVCKDDIESMNLRNGQGASIQADLRLANGKKRSIVLTSASMDIIGAWMDGKTLEEAKAVEPSERTQLLQDKNTNAKKVVPFVLAMIVMVAAFSGGYALLHDWRQQRKEDDKRQQAYQDNPQLQSYESYLRDVSGDEDDIYVYVDDLDEGELVTLENRSDYFFTGDVVLSKDKYDTTDTIPVSMMRPHAFQFRRQDVDDEASSYRVQNASFQAFDYPNVSFSYMLELGFDEDYTWYDIALSDANCTPDIIREMMTYEYAVNDIIQETYSMFYIYDQSHVSYDEYEFYDPASCRYGVTLDLEEKMMKIYENQNGEMVLIESNSMDKGGNEK